MARPLRIEFPGALYHVTTRGDRREPIYRDDADRRLHLEIIEKALDRFDAVLLAYCLMGNHFHLVVQTRMPNLSRFMRQVNGHYTQAFNRRHEVAGHLFQGRFKSVLVDSDAYLVAVCRYVERNPVAAGLVQGPADWPWSSYRAHVGLTAAAKWLDMDLLLEKSLGRPIGNARQRQRAMQIYTHEVLQQRLDDTSFWADGLRNQVFLGSADFAQEMLTRAEPQRLKATAIPKQQRLLARSWADCFKRHGRQLGPALLSAYREAGLTMTVLAREAGLSVSHVSRLIAAEERDVGNRGSQTVVAAGAKRRKPRSAGSHLEE